MDTAYKGLGALDMLCEVAATQEHTSRYEQSKTTNIPIDPALSGEAVIDPALRDDVVEDIIPEPVALCEPLPSTREPDWLSQGPQGDPYAYLPPPLPLTFNPIDEPEPEPATPTNNKRKRPKSKPVIPKGVCYKCNGVTNNMAGELEQLLNCIYCGTSAHPSCLDMLGMNLAKIFAADWACSNCKKCEVCHKATRDSHMLLCDSCDTGWHARCAKQEFPDNDNAWYCPDCPEFAVPHPPADDSMVDEDATEIDGPSLAQHATTSHIRESSIASSHTAPVQTISAKRPRRKTKPKALEEIEIEPELTMATPRSRIRSPRKPARMSAMEPAVVSSSARNSRRKRPEPRTPRMTIRLNLARGKGKEREEEDKNPFEDMLTSEQRDLRKTKPVDADRVRFDKSLSRAQQKIQPLFPPPPLPDDPDESSAGPSSRPLRSNAQPLTAQSITFETPPPDKLDAANHHELRIRTVHIGDYDIQTWYDAPYPEEYTTPEGTLWICEFCLKYMKSKFGYNRHRLKCKSRHPPGDEIYRDGDVSLFEVDGRKNRIYCQNLCLLSKMFLNHKTLIYDVETFLFYVVTVVDEDGARFVGYFSKEKASLAGYNLSCIMTLPTRQRQGWGQFLMDFSYLLSKKEKLLGSPEKPLSALGRIGYESYWTLAIMRFLETSQPEPRLEDIACATSMTVEDVFHTLQLNRMIEVIEAAKPIVRPSPGQAIRTVRGRRQSSRKTLNRVVHEKKKHMAEQETKAPFEAPPRYKVVWDGRDVDEKLSHWESKGLVKVKPENLRWSPYIMQSTGETGASSSQALTNGTTTEAASTDSLALALFDDDVVTPAEEILPSMGVDQEEEAYPRSSGSRTTSEPLGEETEPGRTRRTRRDRSPMGTQKRGTRAQDSESVRTPAEMTMEESLASVMNNASALGQTLTLRRGRAEPVRKRIRLTPARSPDAAVPRSAESTTSPTNENDVKFEDVGTPMTSLTSRQSVPSDDSLFGSWPTKEGDGDEDAEYDSEDEEEEE